MVDEKKTKAKARVKTIEASKAEHLAQLARQAMEDDDEEALTLIFQMME